VNRTFGVLAIAIGAAVGPAAQAAPPGYAPPAAWRELPALAVTSNETPAYTLVQRRAWGDPTAGCYLLGQVVAARPGARTATMWEAMTGALREAGYIVTSPPEHAGRSEGRVRFDLARGAFTGIALADAATSDDGGVTARIATCLYNQREPRKSRLLCEREIERYVAAR
jgi:hypothetical protein